MGRRRLKQRGAGGLAIWCLRSMGGRKARVGRGPSLGIVGSPFFLLLVLRMGFARDVRTFKNMRGNGDFVEEERDGDFFFFFFFVLTKEVLRFMRVTVSECRLFHKVCFLKK